MLPPTAHACILPLRPTAALPRRDIKDYYSYVCCSTMRSKPYAHYSNMKNIAKQRIPNITAPTQHPRYWNARSCHESAVPDIPSGSGCRSSWTSRLGALMPSNCRHAIDVKSSALSAARSDARTSLQPRRRRARCSQQTQTGNMATLPAEFGEEAV